MDEATQTLPFRRSDLQGATVRCLRPARATKPAVLLLDLRGVTWLVKDYAPCAWPVRRAVARRLVAREHRALSRLQGIRGVPEAAFRLDALALAYHHIPGRVLRGLKPHLVPLGFFEKLEHLIREIHSRQIVHLDARNRRNVLLTDEGGPAILDFQTHIDVRRFPAWVQNWLKRIDLSGVYKHWLRKQPHTIDEERLAELARVNRRRWLWFPRSHRMRFK